MPKIFPAILISLLCSTPLYGQNYHTVAGFFSWKGKLKKQIKGKPILTMEGRAVTLQDEGLSPHPAPFESKRNDHVMWGGFYTLKLSVNYQGEDPVLCKETMDRTEMIQLVTTKLNGWIKNGTCISVSGAYDKSNNFVCRKIIDTKTNARLVDW